MSGAEPVLPSLVAMMFAVPAPTAVTTPLLLTVATAVLLLDHVTVRMLGSSVLLLASFSVGVACVVVAWWEGELDREKLKANLSKQIDPTDMETAITTG